MRPGNENENRVLLVISTSAARYTAEQPLLPRVRATRRLERKRSWLEERRRNTVVEPIHQPVMAGRIDRNEMFLET